MILKNSPWSRPLVEMTQGMQAYEELLQVLPAIYFPQHNVRADNKDTK